MLSDLTKLLAQIKYIWPTRWSTVKVIYLLNRYGNLAFLGLADIQLMGMWWNDGPDVRIILRRVVKSGTC